MNDIVSAITGAADRPDWHASAACRGLGNVIDWFPERGQDVRPAKAICADCPVTEQCLDFAITNHESFGIWAGLSGKQRLQLRRSSSGRIHSRQETA